MNKHLRLLIIIGIIVFWLVSTGWLVCYEAFPSYFSRTVGGYRSIMAADTRLMADDWMSVSYAGKHIGYTHNQMEVDQSDIARTYVINNRTVLNLMLLGQPQQVGLAGAVTLDSSYVLTDFSINLTLQGNRFTLNGKRVENNLYEIMLGYGELTTTTQIEIPDDVIIHAPTMQLALGKLKPGGEMKFKTFNPLSMTTSTILARALRQESITVGGVEHATTLIAWNAEGMEVRSWVDRNGRILREESPLGWTMESCEPQEAMKFDRQSYGDAGIADPLLPQLPHFVKESQ